jgi:hypothetical protein
VGNHTDSHPGLAELVQQGGDAVGELAAADLVIQQSSPQPLSCFRPPYGNWRETDAHVSGADRPTSVVATVLNHSRLARTYVGPINWDISGHDYDYWRDGRAAEEPARESLDRIEQAGKGIVLLHDSSDDPVIRARNRTFELTRILVPTLEDLGYRFTRLDNVPQVRSAAQVMQQVAWLAENERFLGITAGRHRVHAAAKTMGSAEQLSLVELGEGRVAIRACNVAFLSVDPDSGFLTADAEAIGPGQQWHRRELGGGRIGLTTVVGTGPVIADHQGSTLSSSSTGEPWSVFIETDLFCQHHL